MTIIAIIVAIGTAGFIAFAFGRAIWASHKADRLRYPELGGHPLPATDDPRWKKDDIISSFARCGRYCLNRDGNVSFGMPFDSPVRHFRMGVWPEYADAVFARFGNDARQAFEIEVRKEWTRLREERNRPQEKDPS